MYLQARVPHCWVTTMNSSLLSPIKCRDECAVKGRCIVPSGIRASGTDERNGICALACVGFVKPAMPYNRYFKKLEDFSKRSTYISGTIKV